MLRKNFFYNVKSILYILFFVLCCNLISANAQDVAYKSTNTITIDSTLLNSFESVAFKTISKTETIKSNSNQHEFNGISRFREILGTEKQKFDGKFIYLSDSKKVEDKARLTWYPVYRNGKVYTYRLYYQTNEVVKEANAGDILLLGKVDSNNLVIIIAQKNSSQANAILNGFGFSEVENANKIKTVKQDVAENKSQTEELVRMDVDLFRNTRTNKIIVSGHVTQIKDGDTIKIADLFTVRLYGIDTPEKKQLCKDKRGKDYNCGDKATKHLQKIIGKGKLTCINEGNGKYGRFLFACSKTTKGKAIDINARMVKDGWAVAEYDEEYKSLETKAMNGKKGIWEGEFIRPKDWRKAN